MPKVLYKGKRRVWQRAFRDNIGCCKYTNVSNCVVRELLAKTDCFSKGKRYFKKTFVWTSKMSQLSLSIAVRPSRLFAEAEFGNACKTAP